MSTPAVDVRDVWLSLRGRVVLEDVNLTVAEGDFLAVIGPNGGGKTMLLRVMLGLLRPDRGSVRLFGRRPRLARGLVGYVPQHPQFDAAYPIHALDVVRMGRLGRSGRRGADDVEHARAALEQVQAGALADRPIGKLSGGELQRVLVARALAVEPRLLLMDEPTASLDPSVGLDLYELLAGLAPRMTVIVVSHDVGVISQHVRSVACVNRRVHHHPSGQITRDMMEATYGCKHDLIVHEHTHRVLAEHDDEGAQP